MVFFKYFLSKHKLSSAKKNGNFDQVFQFISLAKQYFKPVTKLYHIFKGKVTKAEDQKRKSN